MSKYSTLTKVKAYDHYSTYDGTKTCYFQASGEIIGEDEIYLKIRSTRIFYEEDKEPEEEIINVIKSTIVKRVDVEFKWDEEELGHSVQETKKNV
jgi:hypothetical protein